jgi:hypothetical protein
MLRRFRSFPVQSVEQLPSTVRHYPNQPGGGSLGGGGGGCIRALS